VTRPRRASALVRRIALLALLAVAGLLGFSALRDAGFRFRWDPVADGARAGADATPPAAPGAASPQAAVAPPSRDAAPAGERADTTRSSATHSASADLLPGGGDPAHIDFETLPGGGVPCAPCAVSDEWESEGLRVSFRSWTAGSTLPFVLDGREYLPAGRGRLALGPALQGERGLEVGVLRLEFPRRPRAVSFRLFGPDLIDRFAVTAWSGGRALEGVVERAPGGRYDASGRGSFRAERITVRTPEGIDRITLDGWGPPGHILLVDDVVITP